MFEAANIRDWIGLPVVDEADDKVGTLESIYYDTATSEPAFGALTTGIVGFQKLVFVPLVRRHRRPEAPACDLPEEARQGRPVDLDRRRARRRDRARAVPALRLEYRTGSGGERRLGRR